MPLPPATPIALAGIGFVLLFAVWKAREGASQRENEPSWSDPPNA